MNKELEDLVKLGEKIRRERKKLGLIMEAVADEKISTSTISAIEKGKLHVRKEKILYLCNKLKIDPYKKAHESSNDDHSFINLQLSIIDNMIRAGNPDEALQKIRSLNIIKEENPHMYMVQFLKGKCYHSKQNTTKAIEHFNRSIQLIDKNCDKYSSTNIKTNSLNELSRISFYENNLHDALHFVSKAIHAFDPEGERIYLQYTCHINKAIYLEQLNKTEKATPVLDFLWSELEHIENLDVVCNIYDVKAKIHQRSNNYNQAIQIAKKGIEIAQLNRKNERSAELWCTLGTIYKSIKKRKFAEECFNMALHFKGKINKEHLFLDIQRQLGELFLNHDNLNEAKKILEEAIKDVDKNKNKNMVRYTETLATLGECYSRLKLHEEAQATLEKAHILAQKYKLLSLEDKILSTFAKMWENIDTVRFHKYLALKF